MLSIAKRFVKKKRHDEIKRVIYNFVKHCFKIEAFLEKERPIQPHPNLRPADLHLVHFEDGKHLCLDVTVTNVTIKGSSSNFANYAYGVDALSIAEKGAKRKNNTYLSKCLSTGLLFCPISRGYARESLVSLNKLINRVCSWYKQEVV